MKSINQIFKDNIPLLDEPEVKELVEYCQELEGQVMENTQSEQFNLEDKLAEVVRDIYISVNQVIKNEEDAERFKEIEHVDFKQCIKNLREFISKFSVDNNFRL